MLKSVNDSNDINDSIVVKLVSRVKCSHDCGVQSWG